MCVFFMTRRRLNYTCEATLSGPLQGFREHLTQHLRKGCGAAAQCVCDPRMTEETGRSCLLAGLPS